GGALEAVNLLLAGKGDHAMLSEPTASIAVLRARALADKGAPQLVKRVDMREAWTRTFPGHSLASSCVAFFGDEADDQRLLRAFARAYAESCRWVNQHPDEALVLAQSRFPALARQIEQGRGDRFAFKTLSGESARADALFYLSRIHDISPDAIGGEIPGDDFFEVTP
ncbi:MAG TPA: hypothetical protein VKA04_12410, partial [Pseudodesulfovibrio sp.]|nr:hypothetical protein [Pseudodesulfovibrio sp.]